MSRPAMQLLRLLCLLFVCLPWLSSCQSPAVPTPTDRLLEAGERASLLLSRIHEAEAASRYNEALAFADSLILFAPDLPEGHFRRAQILLKLYQLDAADESFQRVTQLDPYHRGAWYQRGHVAFEQGRYQMAVQRYLAQREVILNSPSALKAYYQETDHKALGQAWLQVGRAYQLQHRADSARVAYEHVLTLDSMHAQANAWLSELYDEEGDPEAALMLAQRAWQVERGNPDFAYKVGVLLFKMGSLQEALPLLSWTAEQQPWNAGAHYNLGRALVALGRIDEGRRHMEVTDRLQDLDQEIDQARAAAARFPHDPARWRAVANFLGLAGRTSEQLEAQWIARAVADRAEAEAEAPQSEHVPSDAVDE